MGYTIPKFLREDSIHKTLVFVILTPLYNECKKQGVDATLSSEDDKTTLVINYKSHVISVLLSGQEKFTVSLEDQEIGHVYVEEDSRTVDLYKSVSDYVSDIVRGKYK